MLNAAVFPWLKATSQCSIRIGLPCTGLSYSQMSPAAKMFDSEVSSPAVHLTPPCSPIARPADLASDTSGMTPMPDHHEVAVELEPALRHHLRDALAVALEALHLLAAVDLHAVLLERVLEEAAHLLAEEAGSKVTSSSITISHSTPCAAVSDAATSQPM